MMEHDIVFLDDIQKKFPSVEMSILSSGSCKYYLKKSQLLFLLLLFFLGVIFSQQLQPKPLYPEGKQVVMTQ